MDKLSDKLEEMAEVEMVLKSCAKVNDEEDELEELNRAEVAVNHHGSEFGIDLWRGEHQMVHPGNLLFGTTLLVRPCGVSWRGVKGQDAPLSRMKVCGEGLGRRLL